MEVQLYNKDVEKVGAVELADAVFAAEVSEALLWEQVKAQRASWRAGTHSTKRVSEVSGTGAKPFKQKGGGRARQGSMRSVQHVGGGVSMGPRPRDYSYRLPRSARRAALRSALSLRVKEEALTVLDQFTMDAPKTKTALGFLNKLGSKSALVVDSSNESLGRSMRNIPKCKYVSASAINVYDILNHEKLVITQAALEVVTNKALGLNSTGKEAADGNE